MIICPSCQTENPPSSKFCNECGQKLNAKCPTCGHENPPGAKFCNECGARLTGDGGRKTEDNPPFSPATATQAFIPSEYAAKLETARLQKTMVGERRVVTMLFCDVKGSTAAAGQLDPEDWAQIMNGVFETMIRPVYKFEGTVARLMGDAILAFFGAPVAHEDDPQRAILAGLDIVEGFAPYREKIAREWGLEIDVRVGINTGLVMVGAVGSDLQMEYTALGDAINLAARMEQTATPGTVQVSEDTYKLVAPVFEWDDLGTVQVKGKPDPLHIYRPLQPKTHPGLLRGIEGLDAPMVGRSIELEKLQSVLQRLEQVMGSLIFITGEAGLGKSRLVRELEIENRRSRIENPDLRFSIFDPRFHETASFSYETTQPYALFQRLLRRVYGVGEGDSPAEMWEKFLPILNLIPADVADQGGVFEALFAFHGGSVAPIPNGETFKRQLFELMERLWRHWTDEAPRILIFDDLHWADPASVELLTHLFRLTDTCPVVIVCATRPVREAPGWAAKETAAREYPHRYLEINLRPLTAQDTNQLVDNLLTISDLPVRLRARILEKTDGNPFFIEEVVRTLMENGMVVRETNGGTSHWRAAQHIEDIEIPGNLQALLIARIDRLEENARRTLQLASVIGRTFYFRVLDSINQAIAVVQDELDRQLLTLQRAELIREAARVPELEYIFRHSLTQEAAYNTILIRQRREFHRQVGEAIEHLFPDRAEEFAPVLAHHFGEANDPRAFRYEALAGDAAFRLFAIPEAISHYTRALEIFNRMPGGERERVQQVYSCLGRCYELQSDYEKALEIYETLSARGRELADERLELEGAIAQATVYAIPHMLQNEEKALALTAQALELARRLDDPRAEARTQWIILLTHMYVGRMDVGIPYGERAVELAQALGMQDVLAHALQDLSLAYMAIGELARGRQVLETARPLWDVLEDLPMVVENYANRAFERIMNGDFEQAIALSNQAIELSVRIQNEWGQVNSRAFTSLAYMALGEMDTAFEIQSYFIPLAQKFGHPGSALVIVQRAWTLACLGAGARARQAADEAVEDAKRFPPFHAYALAVRAEYYLQDGDVARGEAFLQRGNDIMSHNKTLLEINIVMDYVAAEVAFAKGDWTGALRQVDALMEMLTRAEARYYLPETLMLQAQILSALGREDAATQSLYQALAVAREITFRTRAWQILARLARRAAARGDASEADSLRQEAKPLVNFILSHTSDPSLQESFRAFVRAEGVAFD